jgi:hypothetical protein
MTGINLNLFTINWVNFDLAYVNSIFVRRKPSIRALLHSYRLTTQRLIAHYFKFSVVIWLNRWDRVAKIVVHFDSTSRHTSDGCNN